MTPHLRVQAEDFALELMETLAGTLPYGNLGFELLEVGNDFALTTADQNGIELQVDQKTVMRLEVQYTLSADSRGERLKVLTSTFALRPEERGTPFFRYDYISNPKSVPSAHINVHAHRDDMIAALLGSGRQSSAKLRRKRFLEEGRLPSVSNFHFPVGGARFRPCLEDVLEVAIQEFGLDAHQGYIKALSAGQMR